MDVADSLHLGSYSLKQLKLLAPPHKFYTHSVVGFFPQWLSLHSNEENARLSECPSRPFYQFQLHHCVRLAHPGDCRLNSCFWAASENHCLYFIAIEVCSSSLKLANGNPSIAQSQLLEQLHTIIIKKKDNCLTPGRK